MSIKIENLNKNFGDYVALNNVSLEIKSGELVALLGPSGSGKTTLLRTIAGLELADSGIVYLSGKNRTKKNIRDRNVGFVFQHYALFKHMSIFENIAFGLKVKPRKFRPSKKEIRKKVLELLSLVHLEGLHDRYPSELSGGQRQRVALARALAIEPKILLLDEPFGALDAKVRKQLRRWIRKLHDEINLTSIFVTHDQEEAMEVADRIVVMSNGKIEQIGTPNEVWQNPENQFVYDFLGNYNEFEAIKDKNGQIKLLAYQNHLPNEISARDQKNSWWKKTIFPIFKKFLKEENKEITLLDHSEDHKIKAYTRPYEMMVMNKKPGGNEYIEVKILHINPAGSLVKLELETLTGAALQAEILTEQFEEMKLEKYQRIFVKPKKIKIFS